MAKRQKKFGWWVFAWVLITGSVWAQCPDRAQVSSQINGIVAADNPPAAKLPQLLRLQQLYKRCRFPSDSEYTYLLMEIGMVHFLDYHYGQARNYARQAIRVAETPSAQQSRILLAKAYTRLGVAYEYDDQHRQASVYFKRSLVVAQRFPKARYWGAYSLIHLAFLSHAAGDYEQAIRFAELGASISQQIGNLNLMTRNLHEKARALKNLNFDAEARQTMLSVLVLTKQFEADPYDLGAYYRLIGVLESKSKQYQQADQYLRQAMRIQQDNKDSDMYAQTANDLAEMLCRQGQNQQAITLLAEALTTTHETSGRARTYTNIGYARWQAGQYEAALQAYQQGFQQLIPEFIPRNQLQNPALPLLRTAGRHEYLLTLVQSKADTWLDWAKATNNPAYFKNALATYQLADQLIDFMRWEHTGQQSKLFWREKTRGMYERAIETCYELKDTANAFRFFEKSRAVMLADKLNELGARQQLPSAQAAQEQTLRQQVTSLQSRLADTKTRPDSLQTALNTAQDNLDRFLKQLETTNPAYYRYKYDSTVPALPDVQQWLGQEKASLVSYFVGDSALYVLGVTPTGAKLIRQPVGRYRQETAAFRQLLADANAQNRNFGQYKTLAHSLYQQLLAPLGLPEGRVVVSPDGFFLPLDALSRRTDQPDFLVNHYAFSYTYSARLLLKDPDRATVWNFPTPKKAFLGLAPVRFPAGLAALPGSDEALTQIGNGFASPMLLTGPTATRRAFLSQSPGHRVIQLFTHADADTSRKAVSEEPVLFFADSSLRLSDLNNQQPFGAELLVLSACRTGLGANQQGEGVFSLARGFASLGIPSIGTTLWSVENQATYRLTELFYEFLQQGLSKDVALQRAKQQFITEGDAANQLPARWAGLILVGDAAPLSQGVAWWVWALGGGVVGLVGVWLWRRGRKGTKE